jgi:hypothetical protein
LQLDAGIAFKEPIPPVFSAIEGDACIEQRSATQFN